MQVGPCLCCASFTSVDSYNAGSTGTRLHVFEFSHRISESHDTGSPFALEREVFEETKPGLSHFANAPHDAAASVSWLLDKALEIVPESMYTHTPLALKATAGLRLLPDEQADAILAEVAPIKQVDCIIAFVHSDCRSICFSHAHPFLSMTSQFLC